MKQIKQRQAILKRDYTGSLAATMDDIDALIAEVEELRGFVTRAADFKAKEMAVKMAAKPSSECAHTSEGGDPTTGLCGRCKQYITPNNHP